MEKSPLQDLIDTINYLAGKYNFSEDEINEIQEKCFAIENGDPDLTVTEEITEFVVPEMEDEFED